MRVVKKLTSHLLLIFSFCYVVANSSEVVVQPKEMDSILPATPNSSNPPPTRGESNKNISKPHILPTISAPNWASLSPTQQAILAPLQKDWAEMGPTRRLKWAEIANRYPKMSAIEQQRLQERMREWANLTPEQRQAVRQSFSQTRKLPNDKKQEKWQAYQQLAAEEKDKLTNKFPAASQLLAPAIIYPKLNQNGHRPVLPPQF